MNVLNHLYVVPITGPNQGRGSTCYVCQLGSSSVIAAFIKLNSPERDTYIKEVQTLYDKNPALHAFVVILSEPNMQLEQELKALTDREKLTIPLTVLDPTAGLPDSIPINPAADYTLLLYRGKHFEKMIEVSPDSPPKEFTFRGDLSPEVEELTSNDPPQANPGFVALNVNFAMDAGFMAPKINAALKASRVFSQLDKAAKQMIERS